MNAVLDLGGSEMGRSPAPLLLALEPRIVLDAAAAATVAEAAPPPEASAPEPPDGNLSALDAALAAPTPEAPRNEIAFIDAGAADWQTLIAGLREGIEVHVLDASRDGLTQINEILAGRTGFDAIHVLSHGASGEITLGNTLLTLGNVDVRAGELAILGQALSGEGDLLIYGCDVGQGLDGALFGQRLSLLTGADVATSSDTTGISGNWTLERASGAIESAGALTSAAQAAYAHDLAFPAATDGTGNAGGNAIALDSLGNLYITGRLSGTVDFDPGSGTTNLTSAGNDDIFVQKLDSVGNLVWARSIGGTSADLGQGISVDASGNVYITGYFQGAVDFDPGSGFLSLGSAGSLDAFVLKLNSSGDLVWAMRVGGTGADYGFAVAVDGSGNVYATGYFESTADFDPSGGTTNLTSAGSVDAFVLKLDSSGGFVWADRFGAGADDSGKSIAVDSSGNVYATGYFQGTVDFDPGVGTNNLVSAGGFDVFVQKLDSAGSLVWAKSVGSTSSDTGDGIAVDGSGNVYATGSFLGTVDFDPGAGTTNLTSTGSSDIFIQKLDSSGNLVWARSTGGTGGDTGLSVAVDGSGNVHVTGSFQATVDFDPGAGIANLASAGSADIFVQKLDSSGNLVWAKSVGGTSGDLGVGIAVSATSNVHTTGRFNGTADFDPGIGTTNLTATGGSGSFVLKLDSGGNATTPAAPSGASVSTAEDTDSGAIAITRNGSDTTHYKITGISGGTLFSDAGFTWQITSGSFIASAGATTNVYFRPTANSTSNGSFTIQAATTNGDGGLSGSTATATVTVTPIADTPSVTNAATNEDTQSSSGLIISRNAADGTEVTHFKITGITGGTLFKNDGTTQATNGSFITFAEGNAGLKFTPAANSISNGSFTVQASTSNSDAGLGGSTATATITVNAVADTPSVTNATTTAGTQTSSGLVLSRNAVDGAEVTHFQIGGVTGGTLYKNDGTTQIANGDLITFAEGNAGLRFTPSSTTTGSFTVEAYDSRTRSLSPPVTATITVSPAPAPVATTPNAGVLLTMARTDAGFFSPSASSSFVTPRGAEGPAAAPAVVRETVLLADVRGDAGVRPRDAAAPQVSALSSAVRAVGGVDGFTFSSNVRADGNAGGVIASFARAAAGQEGGPGSAQSQAISEASASSAPTAPPSAPTAPAPAQAGGPAPPAEAPTGEPSATVPAPDGSPSGGAAVPPAEPPQQQETNLGSPGFTAQLAAAANEFDTRAAHLVAALAA